MFYISKNDTLACKQFVSGDWISNVDVFSGNLSPSGVPGYSVAAGSRHLSATTVALGNNSQYVLLLYEAPSGAVVMLNGSYKFHPSWNWENSSLLTQGAAVASRSGFEISAPFSIMSNSITVPVWYSLKDQAGNYKALQNIGYALVGTDR